MKPAAFDYVAAKDVEHVLELLSEYGEDAKLLAGGQTLGPMLNLRLLAPAVIVDINQVAELGSYRLETKWVIGALTRQSTVEDDPLITTAQPLVSEAIPLIANRSIRNRGTVGGSLAHADPAAEWGALLLALDGSIVLGRRGRPNRSVPAQDFFYGMFETAIEDDELLLEVQIPTWREDYGWSFREVARRYGDFAVAGVACRLARNSKGLLEDVRLGLFGIDERPLRALRTESLLAGETVSDALLQSAAKEAASEIDPLSDLHGSAQYRRELIELLVCQALVEALRRCATPGGQYGE